MMIKYFSYVRVSLEDTLAYRGPLVVWLIGNLLTVATMIFVWSASGSEVVGGYSRPQLVSYYIVGLFLQWFAGWMPFYWLKDEIKNGDIVGNVLTKPVSLYWQAFGRELGWHLVSTPIGFIATLGVVLFVGQNFVIPGAPYLLAALFSSVLAVFLLFSLSLCMGLSAFWFTHIGTLDAAVWGLRIFFGGQGVPVAFLPPVLLRLAYVLPFRYLFSLPLEIYFAKLSFSQVTEGLLIQLIWIVVFVFLFKLMWKRGVRVYSAFGS